MIHQRILDVAGERPDASMAEIAESIGGASSDLVERVLAEYGDPADGDAAGSEPAGPGAPAADAGADAPGNSDGTTGDDAPLATEPTTEGDGVETAATDGAANEADGEAGPAVGRDDLTEKQLDVLRAIHEHPDAAQRELGELLDVSASTVSTRLSAVPGFEWEDRWAFVRRLFDGATDGGQLARPDDDLRERLEAPEERVDGLGSGAPPPGEPDPPSSPSWPTRSSAPASSPSG